MCNNLHNEREPVAYFHYVEVWHSAVWKQSYRQYLFLSILRSPHFSNNHDNFNEKCTGWKRFYLIADDIGKWYSLKNLCSRLLFMRKPLLFNACRFLVQYENAKSPIPVQYVVTYSIINLIFILIYLFVGRHEVHSMNTHTLQNAGW